MDRLQGLREKLLPPQHDNEASGPRERSASSSRRHLARGVAKPTEWATALLNAVVITLMNLVQAFIFAELVCRGTELDPCLVAPLQLFGMIVSQAVFLVRSRIARFAIASADMFFALLCHQVVQNIYANVLRDEGLYARKDGNGFDAWSDGDYTRADPALVQRALQVSERTALAAICVATLLQGAAYYGAGRLQAGEIVQFLPHPVVSGLLSSAGICLLGAAISITLGETVDRPWAASTLQGADLDFIHHAFSLLAAKPLQLGAAAALALASLGLSAKLNSGAAFVVTVPLALLLFYTGVAIDAVVNNVGGTRSRGELEASGWLFAPHAEQSPLDAIVWLNGLADVAWRRVLPPLVPYVSLSLICVLALMLQLLALEADADATIDVNAELRTAGIANLVCGGAGGCCASQSSAYVGALRRAGVVDRRVAIATQAMTIGVLLAGWTPFALLPRFILGGQLLAHGTLVCFEWSWSSRRRMDGRGRLVLYAMISATLFLGITQAVVIGVLVAATTAHLRLASLNALKYHLTSLSYRPPVSRPLAVQRFLHKHGAAVHMLGLEGFLHEGTAARLLRYAERTVTRCRELRYLVLDLGQVQGVDPSAFGLLSKLRASLDASRVRLLLCALEPSAAPLLLGIAARDAEPWTHGASGVFATLEAALEWCEDELVLHGSPSSTPATSAAHSTSTTPDCAPTAPDVEAPGAAPSAAPGAAAFALPHSIAEGAAPAAPAPAHEPAADGAAGGAAAPAHFLGLGSSAAGATGAVNALPFTAAALPAALSWSRIETFGSRHTPRAGDLLVRQGVVSRDLYVAPATGVTVRLHTHDGGGGGGGAGGAGGGGGGSPTASGGGGSLLLATLSHGGVFGAEGALLGLPASCSVTCAHAGAPLVKLSAAQLGHLRTSQPQVLHALLAAGVALQQDATLALARRAALWQGGGWGGPAFDHKTTTATPSTIGAGRQLPSVVTMPDGFGRQQLQQQLFRATAPQGSPPPGEGGGGRGRGRARSTSRDIASHSRV